MRFKEIELLPFNIKTQEYEERIKTVDLSPFPINGLLYNIPSKILNKSFVLKRIDMYYRSDEHKVILSQERDDYPMTLTESTETVYNYNHDQFLMPIEFSTMGKGCVRISLYEVGETNPIRIDKFKP